MLRKIHDLAGYSVCATDGEVGTIERFYLDDATWTVRYFLVKTASSFKERHVLVSPIAVKDIVDKRHVVQVGLKQDMIDNSPRFSGTGPVTRRYEIEFSGYYGWPAYWGGSARWGDELYPTELFTAAPFPPPAEAAVSPAPVTLSTDQLTGFQMYTPEGKLGDVRDAIVSDMSWSLRFLVVDAAPVLPGKQVLVSPHWISLMAAAEKMITIDLPVSAVKSAPPYRPEQALTREDELELFAHYRRADDLDAVFVGRAPARA